MINVSFCQIYFVVSHDLALIKIIVITRVHFVILILKFGSHNFDTATFYQRIREYAVIFFKFKFIFKVSIVKFVDFVRRDSYNLNE